ncbi:MAG TPA: methyltransferase domain-containing protein [Candidatus Limnocylindria bacterium]
MASFLRTRSTDLELLDGEQLDPNELRTNLREMAMLNRLPGGVGDSVRAVDRLLDGKADASVLDIGTGGGDFVRRLARSRAAHVIAADVSAEVVEIARRNLADTKDVTVLQADVLALPLANAEVEVTHSSMLIHHLEPAEVVRALREMRRVARLGIVVNDLRRGPLALAVTAATVLALTRGAYTRHDGVLSARRAYTLPELDELATEAGLRAVWRTWSFWPRVTTVYR